MPTLTATVIIHNFTEFSRDKEQLEHNIYPATAFVGKKAIFLPSCHSTNTEALAFIKEGKVTDGLLVYTFHQTMGRGQGTNTWQAEAYQNITCSIILRTDFLKATQAFDLTMATSVAVADMLTNEGAIVKIKWPNDVYVENKKIGGILIENLVQGQSLQWSVVGIGLNINQTDFSGLQAISLCQVTHSTYALNKLLEKLLLTLEKRYLQLVTESTCNIKPAYLSQLYRLGQKGWFKSDKVFEGTVLGIDNAGRIMIEESGIIKVFEKKEIQFV